MHLLHFFYISSDENYTAVFAAMSCTENQEKTTEHNGKFLILIFRLFFKITFSPLWWVSNNTDNVRILLSKSKTVRKDYFRVEIKQKFLNAEKI